MNILTKIKGRFMAYKSNKSVGVSTTYNGKTTTEIMSAGKADDITEAFFKKRVFGTKKEDKENK